MHIFVQYVPDITWTRDRGSYYFQEITGTVKGVCWAAIGVWQIRKWRFEFEANAWNIQIIQALVISASTVISLFGHMFFVLNIKVFYNTSKNSVNSIHRRTNEANQVLVL